MHFNTEILTQSSDIFREANRSTGQKNLSLLYKPNDSATYPEPDKFLETYIMFLSDTF
jgi:hypothetical protein